MIDLIAIGFLAAALAGALVVIWVIVGAKPRLPW